MKNFTHYGVDVMVQTINAGAFFRAAKRDGIELTELPILEHRVFTYSMDSINKFVVLVADSESETIYTTTQIPLDLSWENLITDCKNQARGESPMKLKTKAKIVCNEACRFAEKIDIEKHGNDPFYMPDVKPEYFRIGLMNVGFNLDEIMSMDHHDVDEQFLMDMAHRRN